MRPTTPSQEAWLRLNRSDAEEIENLGGWLTTVVARVALNMLRSRNTRRETPLDEVHVPDPLIDRADAVDPEHQALLADSVGLALLVVLETSTPRSASRHALHGLRRTDRRHRRALGPRAAARTGPHGAGRRSP